jgi:hypothetical protein
MSIIMKKYLPFTKEMIVKPIQAWFLWLIGIVGTIDTIVSHLGLADNLSKTQKELFELFINTWETRIFIYTILALLIIIWVVFENSFRIWSKYNEQIETEKVYLIPEFDHDKQEMWLTIRNDEKFKIENCKGTLVYASLYNKYQDNLCEPLISFGWLLWNANSDKFIDVDSDSAQRLDVIMPLDNQFSFQTTNGRKNAPEGLYAIGIRINGSIDGKEIKPLFFEGNALFKLQTMFIGITQQSRDKNGDVIFEKKTPPAINIGYAVGFHEGSYRNYVERTKKDGVFKL